MTGGAAFIWVTPANKASLAAREREMEGEKWREWERETERERERERVGGTLHLILPNQKGERMGRGVRDGEKKKKERKLK